MKHIEDLYLVNTWDNSAYWANLLETQGGKLQSLFPLEPVVRKTSTYTWHQIIKTTWSITHAKDNHTVSWVHSFILITTSILDVS